MAEIHDPFARVDESADARFYAAPRLVTHIDDGAVAAVSQLYRECFTAGDRLLDLMTSWVSHLPPEIVYASVAGLGMNAEELAANPRLGERVVRDLNREPSLPWPDASFDGAAICVSIQYLQRPVEVLRDLRRVVRPGGTVAITFSNRCFPTKAVAIWRALGDEDHLRLVGRYLHDAGWTDLAGERRTRGRGDPLYAVTARA